jgi:putative flavoprotein involved in K+ transport
MRDARVVVVGAGPAGLATARELQKRGIRPRVLEGGPALAHTWVNLYDSLTLHTGKHLSTLPGLRFDRSTPLFPTRDHFIEYLKRYATTFDVTVEPDAKVERATPPSQGGRWRLDTTYGTIEADAVVFATGIVANPMVPELPGRALFQGRVLHSIEYRRPDSFRGRRVLVVGVGNSGGEIASELADGNAEVSVSVRSGASIVPLTLLGIPIQYVAAIAWKLPKPIRQAVVSLVRRITIARRGPPVLPTLDLMKLEGIPLIGFHLDEAVRSGRVRVLPCITGFTGDGAHFSDGSTHSFDDVILATGYRPALQPLEGQVRTDARGFALRTDRVTSADQPGLYFVGHNYDVTGGLRNIFKDAPLAAEAIRRRLFHAEPQKTQRGRSNG